MIANFDFYNRFEQPVISLCSPDDKFLGFVDNIKNLTISPEFNAVSEMTCDVYKYSDNHVELEIYDDIKVKRQFFVEDIGFFIITEVAENDGTEGVYKSVTLYSCEHELSYKKLTYFKTAKETYGTYKFWDNDNPSETLMGQILSSLPRWSIGHVDERIAKLHRTFDEPDTTIYSFLMDDVENSYECLFDFDIKNRIINVYDKNNYIRKTTILLSRQDVINNIKVDTKSEEIYTAFTLYGDNEITYNSINPLGTATVYNFNYYKPWMSAGLKDALEKWEANISNAESSIGRLRKTLSAQYTQRQTIQSEIYSINEQIVLKEKQLGVNALDDDMVKTLNSEINSLKEILSEKQKEYNDIMEGTEGIRENEQQLEDIYNQCSFKNTNNFTPEQLKELDAYIYEGAAVDDTFAFTEDMSYEEQESILQDLYSKAKSMLKDISIPTEELSLDTNNFIFQKDFAPYTEQLNTGVIIDIELSDDMVVNYVLLKMEVNYEDKTISLTFGNKYRTSNSEKLWSDWQASVSKSSATLSYERSKYGRAVNSGSLDKMNAFMKSSLNLTLNQIKASDGQSFELTDSGLKGRRIMSDGEVDPQQLWITSNGIVFTDDAWQTIKTALGRILLPDGNVGYGINTEYLLGKMIVGQGMNITNESGTFTIDENGVNMRIGTRNLIQYADVIADDGGTMDKSNFLTSGEIIKEDSSVKSGFRFDRAGYYIPNTEYVLSGSITVLDGKVENLRILNGKEFNEFISFTVDGTYYDSPFVSNSTEINAVLNDRKPHYFVLKFKTGDTIPPDSGNQYTCFQLNAGVATPVKYKISGFQLEQGNTVSDWSPSPEDTQLQIDGLDTRVLGAETNYSQLNTELNVVQDAINTKIWKTDITQSIQEQNILPYPYDETSKVINGLTVTDNGDGSITVVGTATATTNFNLHYRNREDKTVFNMYNGKSYYISGLTKSDWTNSKIRLYVINDSNTSILLRTDTGMYTFIPDRDYLRCGVLLQFSEGAVVNQTFYPMISLGSTAPSRYVSYAESNEGIRQTVNTQYSTFTQDLNGIETTVYNNMNINNLLPYPYYYRHELFPTAIFERDGYEEWTNSGVNWKIYPDGRIVANGTATGADSNFYCAVRNSDLEKFVPFTLEPGYYILHGCPKGGSIATYYMWGNVSRGANTSNIFGYDIGDGKTGQILDGDMNIGVYCTIKKGYTANNIVFYPMLEKGSVKHSYTEYAKSLQGLYTQAQQTAAGFKWLVQSGTSETNFEITDNAINAIADKIEVTSDMIVHGAITSDKIDAAAITADKIDTAAVTADKIAAKAITANEIASETITSEEIATGAITADKIATGSITANQMTIGDYTNYITVDANNPATMLPTSFYGGTIIREYTNSPSNNSVVKPNVSNPYLMFCGYTPFNFEAGDELYIDAVIPNFSSSDFKKNITVWFYGANGGAIANLATETLTFKAYTWNEIKTKIVITSNIISKNPKKFAIGIPCENYDLGIKAGSSIRRKIKGSLIVDGSITANKINTKDLFAQDITATGTITGLKLKATTVEVGANSTIGGFTVWEDSINNGEVLTNTKVGNSTGMGRQGGNWAFWAGNGRFSVQQNGAVYCSDLTAEGGKIGGVTIDGENGLRSGNAVMTSIGGFGLENINVNISGDNVICDVYMLPAGFVFFRSDDPDTPIHTVPWSKIYNLS